MGCLGRWWGRPRIDRRPDLESSGPDRLRSAWPGPRDCEDRPGDQEVAPGTGMGSRTERHDRVAKYLGLRNANFEANGRKQDRRSSDPVVRGTAERHRAQANDDGAEQARNRTVDAIETTLIGRPLVRRPGSERGQAHQGAAQEGPGSRSRPAL